MKIMIKDPNSPYLYTLPLTAAHTQIDHLYIDYLLLFQLFQVVLMRQQSCSTNL